MSRGLLLDTHAVLWYLEGNADRMSVTTRALIEDPTADVFVSAASFWEIAIKSGLGKLEADRDLLSRVAAAGFQALAITAAHAWNVRSLPRHHRDPFDRLLVAQAQTEGLRLVTRDEVFASYDGLDVVW